MRAQKKAPQPMQGFFNCDASRAAGETKNPSPADINKYSKEPESSAVKGVSRVSGAIAPLTARTAAADNSAAGSHPHGCEPLISLIFYLFLRKSSGPAII